MRKKYFSNLGVDFKVFVNNSMGCLDMALFLTPKKKVYTGINTFLFRGVFGVFFAKIIVFMPRVLVLSIKFSFHSISGCVWKTSIILDCNDRDNPPLFPMIYDSCSVLLQRSWILHYRNLLMIYLPKELKTKVRPWNKK